MLEQAELAEAIAEFAERAAHRLRAQRSRAGALQVFIRNSPFREREAPFSASTSIRLTSATQDTRQIVQAARYALRRIFRQGVRYAKAGVMLFDLSSVDVEQLELFGADVPTVTGNGRDPQALMQTVDALNARFGRGTVKLAGAGFAQ